MKKLFFLLLICSLMHAMEPEMPIETPLRWGYEPDDKPPAVYTHPVLQQFHDDMPEHEAPTMQKAMSALALMNAGTPLATQVEQFKAVAKSNAECSKIFTSAHAPLFDLMVQRLHTVLNRGTVCVADEIVGIERKNLAQEQPEADRQLSEFIFHKMRQIISRHLYDHSQVCSNKLSVPVKFKYFRTFVPPNGTAYIFGNAGNGVILAKITQADGIDQGWNFVTEHPFYKDFVRYDAGLNLMKPDEGKNVAYLKNAQKIYLSKPIHFDTGGCAVPYMSDTKRGSLFWISYKPQE